MSITAEIVNMSRITYNNIIFSLNKIDFLHVAFIEFVFNIR